MSPGHSPRRERALRRWDSFVAANEHQFLAAGLPDMARQSIDHWDDLLAHGRFVYHDDPGKFDVAQLDREQYLVFYTLAESYFAAGYEFFPPDALPAEDATRLRSRFGS
jgi:hypothetical protein